MFSPQCSVRCKTLSRKCRSQQIHHQADRGLSRTPRRVAVRIHFNDVEANKLPLRRNALDEFIDLGERQSAGFESARSWSKRGVHGIHVEGHIDVFALGDGLERRGDSTSMYVFA